MTTGGVGKTDYNKLRERFLARQQKQQGGGQLQHYFRPEVNQRYRARILPPLPGRDLYYVEYGVHYNVIQEEDQPPITCAKLALKQKCPVCEFVKTLWKSGTDADIATARDIGVKKRFASNVLVSPNEKEVKIWAYGPQVWDQLSECAAGTSEGIIPIDDPDCGHWLNVSVNEKRAEGKTFPNYIVRPEMKSCPIADKSILSKMHDVHAIIYANVRTYEETRAILTGEEVPGPTSPAPAAANPPAAAAPAPAQAPVATSPAPAPQITLPEKGAGVDGVPASDEELIVEDESAEAPPPVENKTHAAPQAQAPASGGISAGSELVAKARAALAKRKVGGA